MPKIKCAIFISDVGFGHMVRQRQIILELIKQFKNISITVFHSKNLKVLKKSFGNKIKYVKNFNNIFLYKKDYKNTLGELDIQKTKYEMSKWEQRSNFFLKKNSKKLSQFDFFISDLVPEISNYAYKLGKPCFSVCHYTWDWFFKKLFKKNHRFITILKKFTNLSSKFYFPPFTYSLIKKSSNKVLNVNLIANKIIKRKKLKKNSILLMNNGTEVLSSKIENIIPEIIKLKEYKFFLSTTILKKKLLDQVKKSKNIYLINNELKHTYNFISKVDFVIARGGFNTISECIISNTPCLLAGEKNNPEIDENIKAVKNHHLFDSIKDKDWHPKNFNNRIQKYINSKKIILNKDTNNNKFKNNGAKTIVKDMKKVLKNNEYNEYNK